MSFSKLPALFLYNTDIWLPGANHHEYDKSKFQVLKLLFLLPVYAVVGANDPSSCKE
jgi:hypothetical protein